MAANPNNIPLAVLMYIAWKNLFHRKLRAFLTIFGVVIGIGSIFFLLSFGIGLQRLVTNQVIGNQSVKSIDITTPNSKIIKLEKTSFLKIKGLAHVSRIGGSYSFAGILKSGGSEVDTIVYGQDQNYQRLENLSLKSGRRLEQNDEKTILINNAALRAIGLKTAQAALGKAVEVRVPLLAIDKKDLVGSFKVVGVIDSDAGNEVYLPAGLFASAGVEVYSRVKVEADRPVNVAPLRKQIESLGLLTSSPIDTIDQINQIFKFFNVMLVGFGAIGMIVAVLGMFNTLTISLLERTREIGLMIALGGRNRDMRRLFIFEAVILSVVGAVIGIVGAVILGQIINLIMNVFAHHRGVTDNFQLFAAPWWLIMGTVGFMIVIGLGVVYLPARRAERINPIEALRRE